MKPLLILIIISSMLSSCTNSDEIKTITKGLSSDSFIKNIITKEDALFSEQASSSDETPQDCEEFIISEARIKNFFQIATTISRRDYDHELMPSRCYAKGRLESINGESGFWTIDRARRGLIRINNQEEYFFCNECDDEIFYEACDVECIHS